MTKVECSNVVEYKIQQDTLITANEIDIGK